MAFILSFVVRIQLKILHVILQLQVRNLFLAISASHR